MLFWPWKHTFRIHTLHFPCFLVARFCKFFTNIVWREIRKMCNQTRNGTPEVHITRSFPKKGKCSNRWRLIACKRELWSMEVFSEENTLQLLIQVQLAEDKEKHGVRDVNALSNNNNNNMTPTMLFYFYV